MFSVYSQIKGIDLAVQTVLEGITPDLRSSCEPETAFKDVYTTRANVIM